MTREQRIESAKAENPELLPTAIGFGIVYLVPLAPYIITPEGTLLAPYMSSSGGWTLVVLAHFVAALGMILALVRYREQRPLASLGIRRVTRVEVGIGAAAFVIGDIIGALMTYCPSLAPMASVALHPHLYAETRSIWQLPGWSRICLVAIIGPAVEEVGRGYVIERVSEITGWLSVGALAALTGSLTMHLLWGLSGLAVFLVPQVILVLLYCWRRNVAAPFFAHSLTNAYATVLWCLLPIGAQAALHRFRL